jgi:hypothetical protein
MKNVRFYLILLFAVSCITAFAQTTTKIHGNLGVQNVNIIVTETKQGTVSDAKGNYTLLLSNNNKRVNLLYSCIGYQDTVVSLTPKQLQKETINISFRMRPKNYSLEEVTVMENKPKIAYHEPLISLLAYEINEMGLYMIVYRKSSNALLHLTLDLDTLSILPIDRKFEKLYKDVYGQIHLISYDSTYQIGHRQLGDTYLDAELFYGMSHRDFYRIMGNTAVAIDSTLVIATYGDGAQELYYHYFKKGDPNAYLLEYTFDQEGLDLVENIRKFGLGGLIPPPPIYDPVLAIGDSLVLFNFEADKIEFFDKNIQLVGETPIKFHRDVKWNGKRPLKTTWNRMVLVDRVKKTFYAAFLEESILVLHKIDMKTGKTKEVVRLSGFQFVLLPRVNDGMLYFMYHTGNTHSKALYRMAIE